MEYITLAVLVFISHAWGTATAAHAPPNPVKMKHDIMWRSNQLLNKLVEKKYPNNATILGPPDQVDGLSSLTSLLEGYEDLIPSSESQVKAEIKSLKGFLDLWKKRHCGGDDRVKSTPAAGSALQLLQSYRTFVPIINVQAHLRVKNILTQLKDNKGNLDKC
ncbi:leptin-like [Corythoichthys intestinalis]|uniref:leptin-like n=1 Tax=Corythoichthys intestinalis TaxID=161448 RepID=UPI0025A5A552|nr:leptin-like [Corythoichthys intestinalis]XP_061812437.1 leptin-like [Nerophis lumbriciformis]